MKTFYIDNINTIHQSEIEAMTHIVAVGKAILNDGSIVAWSFIGYKLDSNDTMHWEVWTNKNISDSKRELIADAIYDKVFEG